MERLLQVLQQQTEYCTALRDLALRKQAALVKADVATVSELVKAEETLVLQLGKLEKSRQTVLSQLARERNWTQEPLSLATVRSFADPQHADTLTKMEQSLVAMVEELRSINQHNKELIDQSLKMVNYNIQLLSGNQLANVSTYARPGQNQPSEKTRVLLDRKA